MKTILLALTVMFLGLFANLPGPRASILPGWAHSGLATYLKDVNSSLFGFQRLNRGKSLVTLTSPSPTASPSSAPALSLPPLSSGEKGLKVPVLLYHYISDNPNKSDIARNGLSTPPSIFDQQLALLSVNGFATITLDELAAAFAGQASLPAKPIILTFDDGYMDFYYNAAPILAKYHMKGIAFIPTGFIGGSYYMTWGQIEELARSQTVVFGAHSVHHYYLSKSSSEVLKNEVRESKRILEQHVGYNVNWFAYPYGAFNDQVVSEVKQAGFVGAVDTIPGVWQYQSRLYYIPRYRVGTRLGADLLNLVQ